MMDRDHRDLALEMFADDEAKLRERIAALTTLAAQLAIENFGLLKAFGREYVARVDAERLVRVLQHSRRIDAERGQPEALRRELARQSTRTRARRHPQKEGAA